MQQTERGPLSRETAKAIQAIDGGPIQATGKALVTDIQRRDLAEHDALPASTPERTRAMENVDGTYSLPALVPPAEENPHDPTYIPVFVPHFTEARGETWRIPWSTPRSGEALANGAIVADVRRTDTDEAVVLALTNGMAGDPFVVWRMDLKTGNTYNGDYADTMDLALRFFHQRAG